MKSLSDPDQEKNLLTLATKIAELQEQNRSTQVKTNELEKRSTVFLRERDQALLENGRIVASKSKLESLCRELHRHNQQIRVLHPEDSIFSFVIQAFCFRKKVLNDNVTMKQNAEN
jgi:predicted RNase H-like nuclease (RuvC/YqgF family)